MPALDELTKHNIEPMDAPKAANLTSAPAEAAASLSKCTTAPGPAAAGPVPLGPAARLSKVPQAAAYAGKRSGKRGASLDVPIVAAEDCLELVPGVDPDPGGASAAAASPWTATRAIHIVWMLVMTGAIIWLLREVMLARRLRSHARNPDSTLAAVEHIVQEIPKEMQEIEHRVRSTLQQQQTNRDHNAAGLPRQPSSAGDPTAVARVTKTRPDHKPAPSAEPRGARDTPAPAPPAAGTSASAPPAAGTSASAPPAAGTPASARADDDQDEEVILVRTPGAILADIE